MAGFVSLSAQLATAGLDWPRLAVHAVLALLLIVEFRLWDDLSDLPRDRVDHPERVLCRAPSLNIFRAIVCLLGGLIVGLTAAWLPMHAVVGVTLLHVGYLVWYRLIHPRAGTLVQCHIVLLKYPLFVGLLSGSINWPVLIIVYLCFCVFDLLDDVRFEVASVAWTVMVVEVLALVAVAVGQCVLAARQIGRVPLLQVAVSVVGSVWLAGLVRRHQLRLKNGSDDADGIRRSSWLHYGVFFVGLAWVAAQWLSDSPAVELPQTEAVVSCNYGAAS